MPIPRQEALRDSAEGELIAEMFRHNRLRKELDDLQGRGSIERAGSHPDDAAIIEQRKTKLRESMESVNAMIRKLQSESPTRFANVAPITDISQDYDFLRFKKVSQGKKQQK